MMKENVTEMSQGQLDALPTEDFVKIHNSLQAETLKAPCRYVNFIKSYYNILNRKKTALLQKQTMLSVSIIRNIFSYAVPKTSYLRAI